MSEGICWQEVWVITDNISHNAVLKVSRDGCRQRFAKGSGRIAGRGRLCQIIGGTTMKIVYILGNGFDLNLKLETSYASFLSYYLDKTKDVKDETIQKFREIIKEGKEEDWSDVELALGQCTSNFATFPNPTRDYEKCYASILENLVEYLKLVEAGMPEDTFGRECLEVFAKSLKNLAAGLKRTDQEEIKGILDNLSEGQSFSIITFNYTHIADYLMDVNEALEEADVHVMGKRIHRGTKYYNKLVKLIHVQ